MLKKKIADKIDERMDEKRKSDWDKLLEEKAKAENEYADKAAMDEFLNKVKSFGLQNMDDTANYIRVQIDITRNMNRRAVIAGNTLLYNETGGILAFLNRLLDLILLGDEVVREAKETESMNEKEEAMNYV